MYRFFKNELLISDNTFSSLFYLVERSYIKDCLPPNLIDRA